VIILLGGVDWLPVEVGLEMYGEKPVVLPFFTGYVSRGLLLHFFGRLILFWLGLCMRLTGLSLILLRL